MSAVEVLVAAGALACVAMLIFLAAVLALPAISEAVERARVDREAQEASWRIHQQATRAFGRMLDAARDDENREGRS